MVVMDMVDMEMVDMDMVVPDQTRLSEFRTVACCLVYFVSGRFQILLRVQQEQREKYQVLRNPKITKTLTAWV